MANLIWSWDMESGTTTANIDDYPGNGKIGVSTDKAHNGTKSLYYSYASSGDPSHDDLDGTDGTNSPAVTMGNLSEFFIRFWWWTPSGLTFSPPGGLHGWRIKEAYSGADGLIDSVYNDGSNVLSIDCFDTGFDSLSAHHSLLTLPTDQWFKYEMRGKMNTSGASNGIMQIWINGVLEVDKSNVKYSNTTYPWNKWMLVTNFDSADAGDYWYFDEFELWDGIPDAPAASNRYYSMGYARTLV